MINAKTRICGLIGNPVEHSLSPIIHNAAFSMMRLNYAYVCFNVPRNQLSEAIEGVRALDFVGFNLTIPHKKRIIDLLDDVDENAEKIGAVNTVVNRKGILTGYNTDWVGVEKSVDLLKKKVVIIGAGGAARAVVFCAIKNAAEVTIVNRTKEKAKIIAEEFGGDFGSLDRLKKLKGDIIINTTPVGMYPNSDESIADIEVLKNFTVAFDIVYNPIKTKFLKLAEKAGCKTIDGLWMLVHQGAEAFQLWTGNTPDVDLMYSAARKSMGD